MLMASTRWELYKINARYSNSIHLTEGSLAASSSTCCTHIVHTDNMLLVCYKVTIFIVCAAFAIPTYIIIVALLAPHHSIPQCFEATCPRTHCVLEARFNQHRVWTFVRQGHQGSLHSHVLTSSQSKKISSEIININQNAEPHQRGLYYKMGHVSLSASFTVTINDRKQDRIKEV